MNLETSQTLLAFSIAVLPAMAVIGVVVSYHGRTRSPVHRWARCQGLELVECEARSVVTGPFAKDNNHGRLVFRVTVRDREGTAWKGWVSCRRSWLGMGTEDFRVQWD